ncbi:MAG TPA: endolytic transglycosylase MltG [Thermoanaerobaculia bacterium]
MSAVRRLGRLFLLLALLGVTTVIFLFHRLQHPPRPSGPPRSATLLFPPGTPTSRIFQSLAREGVLYNAWLSEAYFRIFREGTSLQAGEYRFDCPTPIDVVIDHISRGDVVRYTVVVPEGLTAEETFELFWKQGLGTSESFRRSLTRIDLLPGLAQGAPDLEGFLFPETYSVTRSNSARQIVERMVTEFRRRFTPEMRQAAHAQGLTPREAVTLASIVEKESGLEREGPIIASVYLNRLRHGMHLQADPTVAYALKRDGRWTGMVHRSDYGYESPYNTYLVAGLPPGPICNPGTNSLKAAVLPARTEYLYFVADESGGHTFSKTFEEHLRAIAVAHRARADAAREKGETAGPATD